MSLPFPDVGAKVIAGIAVACTLGGGTVVLDAQRDNAVQDTKIETLEKQHSDTIAALKDVSREVSDTNKKLERVIGRLEGAADGN